MRRGTLVVLCLAAPLSLAFASAAPAWQNPANDPKLLNQPIEDSTYDTAHRCHPRSTPGIRMLTAWMGRHFRGESWGVYRCERLSKNSRSLHSEGRALDWHLEAKNPRDRRNAYFLISRLLATDANGNEHALARRMGIEELIFNCQSWFAGADGLGPYSACEDKHVDRTTAHRNHVHIGMNWAGAKAKTSFWRLGFGKR
jgi:hypothetical protein